jgi:hypothetical protein
MSACIQPAPLTPTRSAGFAIEAGSLATSARPTPNATAERRACVAGARPRRVHLALRVGALGRSLDRGDPVRLEVVDPRRRLQAPGGPRAARRPRRRLRRHPRRRRARPTLARTTQRWPAPSGQARLSGQRRRVDPASAWARQWVLRDPAAVSRCMHWSSPRSLDRRSGGTYRDAGPRLVRRDRGRFQDHLHRR